MGAKCHEVKGGGFSRSGHSRPLHVKVVTFVLLKGEEHELAQG